MFGLWLLKGEKKTTQTHTDLPNSPFLHTCSHFLTGSLFTRSCFSCCLFRMAALLTCIPPSLPVQLHKGFFPLFWPSSAFLFLSLTCKHKHIAIRCESQNVMKEAVKADPAGAFLNWPTAKSSRIAAVMLHRECLLPFCEYHFTSIHTLTDTVTAR